MSILLDTDGERAHTTSLARSVCPMSMTLWVNCSGTWDDWANPMTIQYAGGTADYHGLMLTWEIGTPTSILTARAVSRANGGTTYGAETPGGFAFGEWHFIAGVFEGSGGVGATSRKVRLDNGTTYSESTSVTPTDSARALTIGSRASASTTNQFLGKIAHAAIWNKALSDSELLELYSKAPPDVSFVSNLAQYYPFVSGDLYNETINNYDMTNAGVPSYSSDEPTFSTGSPLILPHRSGGGMIDLQGNFRG